MLPDRPSLEAMRMETARLELAALRPDDADELFPVLSDEGLGRSTGALPPADVAALRERFERWAPGRSPGGEELWLNWVVRRRSDRSAIGHVQATVGDGAGEVAWVIGTSFQGRGFATEAGTALTGWLRAVLGVPVIRCAVHPDHLASRAVAERIGLRPTDERRDGEVIWTDEPR
jgi:RimJ/RimL family protein N-acetyltransferase